MSLGSGIFYSTILVLLFAGIWFVSHKRAWKRIGILVGIIIAGMGLLVVGLSAWSDFANRPSYANGLSGLTIGMTSAEVKVQKGTPDSVTNDNKGVGFGYRKSGYSGGELVVYFGNKDGLEVVRRVCQIGGTYEVGLHAQLSNEEDVIRRFGKPSREKFHEDELSKKLYYPNYNLIVVIANGLVAVVCAGDAQSASTVSNNTPARHADDPTAKIVVNGPDGLTVEFPAGTDEATIKRVMSAAHAQLRAL